MTDSVNFKTLAAHFIKYSGKRHGGAQAMLTIGGRRELGADGVLAYTRLRGITRHSGLPR